jgi:hypothetical protein
MTLLRIYVICEDVLEESFVFPPPGGELSMKVLGDSIINVHFLIHYIVAV